jgi:hypothetical protein
LPGDICVECPSWIGIAEVPPEVLRNSVLAQRLILNPQDARESASVIA